jgi:hypothetical protein
MPSAGLPTSMLVVVGITAEVNESVAMRCKDSGIAHVPTKPIT